MKKVIIFLLFFIAVSFAQSSIIGKWKTIDDETGKTKSIVEIYEKNGKFFGKVVKLFRNTNEDQDPVCEKCSDYRKDQKILGMLVITNLKKEGEEYKDGEILDPKKGKIYRCKIWLEDGKLKVRGYWGFLYRTQTWYKEN